MALTAVRVTAISVLVAAVVGTSISAYDAWSLHYPQSGLHYMTLELWTESIPAYLLLGLVCGVVAAALQRLVHRHRSGGRDEATSRTSRPHSAVLLAAMAILVPAIVLALQATDHLRLFAMREAGSRPNVLLIVLDTVRADHLSTYGYQQPTSPALDEFAKQAIRFENFFSTSIWTLPSHASLFTGLFPIRHGATQEFKWLGAQSITLAEILGNAGYRTFGASANPNASGRVNLAQGFGEFHETWRLSPVQKADVEDGSRKDTHHNNHAFLDFLERTPGDRPFFAFINYIEAHVPLTPPLPYLEAFLPAGADLDHAIRIGRKRSHEHYIGEPYSDADLETLSDLYDAEIAFLSATIGRLFESFRQDPRFDDTLIVITSDHGEHFGEHGLLGHMFGLYNTTVRVPLLIRLPGGVRGGGEESRRGQLVDLFPTILAAAGLDERIGGGEGINLLDEAAPRREAVLSEYYYPAAEFRIFSPGEYEAASERLELFKRRLRAIELYGHRYIWSSDGRHELYNILSDPAESRNLLAEGTSSEMARELHEKLVNSFVALLPPGERDPIEAPLEGGADVPELDSATRDALRSLGYVR
jgi:arylsulfatase A-like enzyme